MKYLHGPFFVRFSSLTYSKRERLAGRLFKIEIGFN